MTTPPTESKGCFPASAHVMLASGQSIPLAKLRIGDHVLAGLDSTGNLLFSEVYMFGHRDAHTTSKFVELSMASGARLRLTPDHHLPVSDTGEDGMSRPTHPSPSPGMGYLTQHVEVFLAVTVFVTSPLHTSRLEHCQGGAGSSSQARTLGATRDTRQHSNYRPCH